MKEALVHGLHEEFEQLLARTLTAAEVEIIQYLESHLCSNNDESVF